jgi:hypothetical protein
MTVVVRDAVARALSELVPGGEIDSWSGPEDREWSWHWDLHVSGPDGGALLLKIPRWEEAPTLGEALAAGEQDSTHAEIDGLRRIEAAVLASGDPGLTAVAPVGYVGEVNGILLRRMSGTSLRDRLGRGRGSGDVGAIFERLGRWIRVFHQIDGPPVARPFDAEAAVERSRALERGIRAADRAPRGLLPAMAVLRLAAEGLDGTPEPWAEIHGDLNLSNVLVGRDDRVAVIDPNREGASALTDPVRVLTDTRLDRWQLITSGVGRPSAVLAEWEQRLLHGSGLGGEAMLGFRLAEAAIERWVELESGIAGFARLGLLPGRRLLRRVVRTRLDRIV